MTNTAKKVERNLTFWSKKLRRYSKQVEATGLLVLLLAAYFQFSAESYRRQHVEHLLEDTIAHVEYVEGRLARLFKCTANDDCEVRDYRDKVKAEALTFSPTILEDREPYWRSWRQLLFFIGALLVAGAKFADWPDPDN